MKHVRTFALLAVSLLGAAALAQQNPPPQPPAGGGDQPQGQRRGMPSVDDQLKMMTDKLGLTADQQAKIKPILEDQRTQAQAVMKDDSLSQDDKRTKMHSLHESTNSKVSNLLTDDQKKKYTEWQQEMHDRMRQPPPGGDSSPK